MEGPSEAHAAGRELDVRRGEQADQREAHDLRHEDGGAGDDPARDLPRVVEEIGWVATEIELSEITLGQDREAQERPGEEPSEQTEP